MSTIALSDPGAGAPYFRVATSYADPTTPRAYYARSSHDWPYTPLDGFAPLVMTNEAPAPPPSWEIGDVWVRTSDPTFHLRPTASGRFAIVDLSATPHASGDVVTLVIDGSRRADQAWNHVVLAGQPVDLPLSAPEPAGAVLALYGVAVLFAALGTLLRRRRR